jgi:L-methionine (R)-S-oxide reductase
MRVDYQDLISRLSALCEGEHDEIAIMASVVCEVFHCDDRFDWVGFYRVTEPELLKIGPYQGGHGCLTIPFSKGICGAAARSGKPQLIDDVNAIGDHIACAASTQSEVVIPVFDGNGRVTSVLDIDSDQPKAFTKDDIIGLSTLLEKVMPK